MSPQRSLLRLNLITLALLALGNPARGELMSTTTLVITNGDINWDPRGVPVTLITSTRGDAIESAGVTGAPVVNGRVSLGTITLRLNGSVSGLSSIMIDPDPDMFLLVDGPNSSGPIDIGASHLRTMMGQEPIAGVFTPPPALPLTVSVGPQSYRLENLRLEQVGATMSSRTYELVVNAVPTVVPEPDTWVLLASLALGGVGLLRRRLRP
jgi:hypothetical protein